MKSADPEIFRASNRFLVMDVIRRRRAVARVEISEATQLSATTISSITASLLAEGLIEATPTGSVKDSSRGRPKVLLTVRKDAGFVVGVKLTPEDIVVVITDFVGEPVASLRTFVRLHRQHPAVAADLTEDCIRRCIREAGLLSSDIRGVAVGVPGVVERSSGICRRSPVFQQTDVSFASELTARLGCQVIVDTDANAITLAEHWFDTTGQANDFIVVSLDAELGLGVMHNGTLFRGANGLTPDLGDIVIAPSPSSTPRRLAEIASLDAVLSAAGVRLPQREPYYWTTQSGVRELSSLATTDPEISLAIAAAGQTAGWSIANLIALFSPPKVLLAGNLLALGPTITDPLLASVRALIPSSFADVTRIEIREWQDEMWARGAAAMSLLQFYGSI